MKFDAIGLAEMFGVHPVLVEDWREKGMPFEEAAAVTVKGDGPPAWTMTRRELAAAWGAHPDTLSRWMPEGLAACVVERRGKNEPVFDLRLASRFKAAKDGSLAAMVLEDFQACAKARIAAVHVLSPIYSFMREDAKPKPKRRPKK